MSLLKPNAEATPTPKELSHVYGAAYEEARRTGKRLDTCEQLGWIAVHTHVTTFSREAVKDERDRIRKAITDVQSNSIFQTRAGALAALALTETEPVPEKEWIRPSTCGMPCSCERCTSLGDCVATGRIRRAE